MALGLKYIANYDNPQGDQFILAIALEGYTGQPIEMRATARIQYGAIKDLTQAIRPSTCTISLEASETQTFEDLFTDKERQAAVGIIRNGSEYWQGWVIPDGWFNDYVNDKWVVNLDCEDGLRTLKNLSYVDSSGQPYRGFDSVIKIIAKAVNRSGVSLPIALLLDNNDNDPVQTEPITGTPQDYVDCTINQTVYNDEDKDTIVNCYDVLESLLAPGLYTLFQQGDRWVIANVAQVASPASNGTITVRVYDENGENPTTETTTIFTTLGSQINGFDPFWVNENQRWEGRPTLSGTRSEFRLRKPGSVILNSDFDNNGTVIDDWTILPGELNTRVFLDNTVTARILRTTPLGPGNPQDPLITQSAGPVTETFGLEISYVFSNPNAICDLWVEFKITNTASGNDYHFRI